MVPTLTLLEQLGFKPTELERRVLGNPSFQWLYNYLQENGWPRIANLAAGNVYQIAGAMPGSNALRDLMAPSALRKWAEEFYGHLISVLTLVATVRRDYNPIPGAEEYNDPDKHLLTRLQYWLSDTSPGFRWDRFMDDHDESVRTAAVAKQKTGVANLVIFRISRLTEGEQQKTRQIFQDHLHSVGILPAKDSPEYLSALTYHLPATGCLGCNRNPYNEHHHPLIDSMSGRKPCGVYGAIGLLDCGDAESLKRLLPRNIQRMVHASEFELDRRFLGISIGHTNRPVVFATAITSDLDIPTQKRLYEILQQAAKGEKEGKYEVLRPKGQKFNSIIVGCADPVAWDHFGYEGIVEAIKNDDSLAEHLEAGSIQLTRFGTYDPKKIK